jgi:hypothetical protein
MMIFLVLATHFKRAESGFGWPDAQNVGKIPTVPFLPSQKLQFSPNDSNSKNAAIEQSIIQATRNKQQATGNTRTDVKAKANYSTIVPHSRKHLSC